MARRQVAVETSSKRRTSTSFYKTVACLVRNLYMRVLGLREGLNFGWEV